MVGLVAAPSLYLALSVIMESVGKVCKAKTKYLKLMYVYHSVRKSIYTRMSNVAARISCTDVFVVSALVKVAILLR